MKSLRITLKGPSAFPHPVNKHDDIIKFYKKFSMFLDKKQELCLLNAYWKATTETLSCNHSFYYFKRKNGYKLSVNILSHRAKERS